MNKNEDFYNDVCFKYKTPNNSNIYIQSRRDKYFINEPFCESNCIFIGNISETKKAKCKCPLKLKLMLPEYITFTKINKVNPFNKTVIAPNIQIMKCPNIAFKSFLNLGFFLTLFSIIIFIISYLYRFFYGKLQKLKDLKNKIEEEYENLFKPKPKSEPESKPDPSDFPDDNSEDSESSLEKSDIKEEIESEILIEKKGKPYKPQKNNKMIATGIKNIKISSLVLEENKGHNTIKEKQNKDNQIKEEEENNNKKNNKDKHIKVKEGIIENDEEIINEINDKEYRGPKKSEREKLVKEYNRRINKGDQQIDYSISFVGNDQFGKTQEDNFNNENINNAYIIEKDKIKPINPGIIPTNPVFFSKVFPIFRY